MPFDKLVFDFAPWSMSKAKLALQCPFAFNLKYVQRISEKKADKSSANRIGVAVHEVLEDVIKGMPIKSAYQKGMAKHQLTSVEMDESLAMMHNVQTFMERLAVFKRERDVTEQHVEKKFGLDKDLHPVAFFGNTVFFRGVWDLCLRAQSKYLIIIDHKTGQAKIDISQYEDQLRMYAIAGVRVFEGIEGVQAALNYIQGDTGMVWDKMHKPEQIQTEFIEWFEGFLNNAATCATRTHAHPGYWCGYCAYVSACPIKATATEK